MRTILHEAKKSLSFRETWIGVLIALGFLILMLKISIFETADVSEQWNGVFQDIRTYGATLTAFLLVTGLSRLMCYERERKTDALLFTAANGRKITFFSKIGFASLYCLLAVSLIGTVSLLVHGGPSDSRMLPARSGIARIIPKPDSRRYTTSYTELFNISSCFSEHCVWRDSC